MEGNVWRMEDGANEDDEGGEVFSNGLAQ